MKISGSSRRIQTIVKLGDILTDDFCNKNLKEGFINNPDLHISNRSEEVKQIINSNNKQFLLLISFEEFIKNEDFFVEEKKIRKIFIPVPQIIQASFYNNNNHYHDILQKYSKMDKVKFHFEPYANLEKKLIKEKDLFYNSLRNFKNNDIMQDRGKNKFEEK